MSASCSKLQSANWFAPTAMLSYTLRKVAVSKRDPRSMSDSPLTDSQRLLVAYAFTPKPAPIFYNALGEFNDQITRNTVERSIVSYLKSLRSNKTIYDYQVVCDQTNNPPSVIDQHELFVDITVSPLIGPPMSARIPAMNDLYILEGMRALFSHLKMPKGFSI
ncbi:MAG: hypothetical protein EOP84_07140 [Verrucomicrobiaceae bacterium]|nr:MAG: hypothetical protein EOP84_07140 [Verrucomicrobiaceae bacterium]